MSVEKKYTIGIDIGGTKMAAVLYNGDKVLADYKLATPKDDVDKFLVILKALTDPLLEKAKNLKVKVAGIGIGMPGAIDKETGNLYGAPNLHEFEGKPIGEIIQKSLAGLPVFIDNDANAFIRGEALRGAAKNYKNVYGFTLGTGIGSVWWNNGEIYQGAFGGGNESGHMVVNLASDMDFEKSYQQLTHSNAAKLADEAILGDPLAQKVFEEFGQHLGAALANIVNVLDPEVFVIGGSVMESADLFLSSAQKTMKKYICFTPSSKKVKVLKSKLGQDAGAIGAALLVK